MKAIVVDLETLGKGEAAHILTIGAVCVDLDSLTVVSEFYTAVSGGDQDEREIDVDTMEWWEKQAEESEQAYIEALHRRRHAPCLSRALAEFDGWLDQCEPSFNDRQVFGNGPEFDNKILEHAYRQYDIKTPWKYSNNQSIRTMALIGREILGMKTLHEPFEGIKHHALDDAKHEAKVLMRVWSVLSGQSPVNLAVQLPSVARHISFNCPVSGEEFD